MLAKIGKKFYKFWMKFAHGLAVVNTAVLLTLVYVVLIGPMSLVLFLLRKDPLGHRIRKGESYWQSRENTVQTVEESKHQF